MSKVDHYERKRQYVISLPPTVARWLELYGNHNLSVGILEAARQVTDVDKLYPEYIRTYYPRRGDLSESHAYRKANADQGADWSEHPAPEAPPASGPPESPPLPSPGKVVETDEQRVERIARNTALGLRGVREGREREQQRLEQEAIEEAFARSRQAFDAQRPLPDHANLLCDADSLRIYKAVMARCKETFGWEKGPKPAHLIERDIASVFGPPDAAERTEPAPDQGGAGGAPEAPEAEGVLSASAAAEPQF